GEACGRFEMRTSGETIDAPVEELAEVYYTAIPRMMEVSGGRGNSNGASCNAPLTRW
ncbi:MAG: hypothetical protein HY701_03480, partial [Gemmatimonadetes bacterium]|nr:hypothetical protein [Gemmatimonadota bacterium]